MAATRDRKAEHITAAAGAGVVHASSTGLRDVRLRHRALPERDLASVSLGTRFAGVALEAPLLISSMTGGTPRAREINERLARAAAEHGVGMALGSGRRLLEDPSLLDTYLPGARPPLLLANLGAAQIRRPDGAEAAERLVELLGADGLVVHLNAIQEAVQPEGEPAFSGVVAGIAAAAERLRPLPVVAKEVGFGLDPEDVRLLAGAGVAAVDVAGSGGTNWALVEGRRDEAAASVAAAFADWGIATVESLVAAREAVPGLPLIASGGLHDGVDAAKCLALGADLAAMARPLLIAAMEDQAGERIGTVVRQLRIATWASGAASAAELAGTATLLKR